MGRAFACILVAVASAMPAMPLKAQRCDEEWKSRGVAVERTIVLEVTPEKRGAKIPRPFADELLEQIAGTFRLPAKISVPLFFGPVRFPLDSSPKAKATWVHPDLHALIRVTLDPTGVMRRMFLYEPTYDPDMDSAFVKATRLALTDTAWLDHRPPQVFIPGFDNVFDVELSVDAVRNAKERATFEKSVRENRLAQVPVARLKLMHFPDATPPAPIKHTGMLRYPEAQRRNHQEGYVSLHAVLDTNGKMMESWFPETTNQDFTNAVLNALVSYRFVPLKVSGCPVRGRFSEPFNFTLTPR